MNSTHLNNLSILAVLASFLLLPVSTLAAGMAFTFTGVIAMLCADYGRTIEPLALPARIIAFEAPEYGMVEAREAA